MDMNKVDVTHDEHAVPAADAHVDLAEEQIREQIAAQIRVSKLRWYSKSSIQLYIIFAITYCNSWGTGFDSSLSSAMNANNHWHSFLGVPKTGGLLGITTAMYVIGNLVGSFAAGPASDRWGRRIGMFIGSAIVVVGAIILCTAPTLAAYMVGRFITGFGIAICRSSAPSYLAEISPPQWRGPVVLLYNSLWLIGAILASAIAYAVGPIAGNLSWRLPLVLQVIPSSVVLLTCLFLPESPRWLIANDRYEEATKIMAKYHDGGDLASPLVALEVAEMRHSIGQEASDKRWYDYSELVATKGNRYRTFLIVSMACIGQWGGSNLTSYYLANLLRGIGITSQSRLLTFNLAYYVAALGGAIIGSLISERVGRRALLIFGSLSMSACLIGLTATTSQYHKGEASSLSNLTIAFIFFVGIFHTLGINPMVVAYPVEILHTNTRAKGMALNNFTLNCVEFINTYATPIGLAKIKWKMYIIYAVWNIVQASWVYFFFVETKGHTLEEMDAIFESRQPVKESLKMPEKVDAMASEDIVKV